jgi:hypothetical protein
MKQDEANTAPAPMGQVDLVLGLTPEADLLERLKQRTLPKHGGREADSWNHHWNLTPGDSELHAEAAKRLSELEHEAAFYKRRVQALQQWQSRMRDPERTVVCDILANGFTLDPPVPRDRYELKA